MQIKRPLKCCTNAKTHVDESHFCISFNPTPPFIVFTVLQLRATMHSADVIFFVFWIWLFLANPNFWVKWGYFVFNILIWVKYHFQYSIFWGSCVVCVVCGPQPGDGGDGGRKPLLTEDPPACMSRIIHFQEKEKANLTDIVSMKVSSALSSKCMLSSQKDHRVTRKWY